MSTRTAKDLRRENEILRRRLEEAEEMIRAIRAGEIDAVLVDGEREQVFTLETPENPYRLLVAQVPHPAATLRADGTIIACNHRFAGLLERPASSLCGQPLSDFVAPDSEGTLKTLLNDGWDGEFQDTVTLLRADGGPVSCCLRVGALQEGALGSCLIVTDLTERRHYEELERTQQALRDSERRLASDLAAALQLQDISSRLIQEDDGGQLYDQIVGAAQIIMRSDFASLQFLEKSTGSLRLLAQRGFPESFAEAFQLVEPDTRTTCGVALRNGRRVIAFDLTHFDGIAGTPSCEQHLKAGIRAAQSTPLISRSGDLLGMISTHWKSPHKPEDRELRLLDALARQAADLIERTHSERALQASEARLRSILDNIPAVVYVVDDQQRFRFINRYWNTVLNLANKDVAGRPIADFFPADVAEQFARVNRGVLETRQPAECEEIVPHEDGPHTYISSKVPLLEPDGTASAICGISIDITDRKRSEQALLEADRHKDEFLATLAHEMRNPLAPIRNAVEVLKAHGSPVPELQVARDVIDRQVQVMARLLDDLLDVSRVSRSDLQIRKEPVDLSSVLETALETSRPVVDANGHELRVSLPPEPVYLEADPLRLAQVFANLLNNAAKYTEAGGRIHLSVRREGSDVVVSVKDNGIGISAEMLPRLFEIFSQAKPSLMSQGGLGIGLSLVKGLVELHGGTIEARSEGKGQGSEFLVRLPASTKAPPPKPDPPKRDDPPQTVARRHVLIVDDNRDSADMLARLLKILGHDVDTAYDGEQAVAAAESLQPDVVLLDIGMPKCNGYEACRRIREQPWGRNLFLIALTGWGQEEDRRRTEEAGFNLHMVKPVDPGELMKLLASLSPK